MDKQEKDQVIEKLKNRISYMLYEDQECKRRNPNDYTDPEIITVYKYIANNLNRELNTIINAS